LNSALVRDAAVRRRRAKHRQQLVNDDRKCLPNPRLGWRSSRIASPAAFTYLRAAAVLMASEAASA